MALEYRASEWGKLFHSLSVNELLGAGAAGPGKSMVLLFDPLEQILVEHQRCYDKNHPHFQRWGQSTGWALHLRRESPMLQETIQRSQRFFPQIDPNAHFDTKLTTWTFSSGFKYQFGHCQHDSDWGNYLSKQYCMPGSERVVMADGSLRRIDRIFAGDFVMTLEGPRPVVATWETGVKSCVEAVVRLQGETVGTHLLPTTHPVLALSNVESTDKESLGTHQGQGPGLSPSREVCWQDYESLLSGLRSSPVRRVSKVDQEISAAASSERRQALERLPKLCAQVVLHEPSARRALDSRRYSTKYGDAQSQPEASLLRCPTFSRPQLVTREDHLHTDGGRRQGWRRIVESCVCGGEDARTGLETTTGCLADCSACLRLRGGRPLSSKDICQGLLLRRGGAGTRIQTESTQDVLEPSLADSQSCELSSYRHFYSGEVRPLTEGVRTGTLEMKPVGCFQTYDLTVDGANHYITEFGLVSSQTHIGFDELTQFNEEQYHQVSARLRSGDPVLRPLLKIRSCSNPFCKREKSANYTVNDPHWVRKRFVDPEPNGRVILRRVLKRRDGTKFERTMMYLPATLYDNPDKDFVQNYEEQLIDKPAHIRQAMLYGDWYVTVGSHYADDWNKDIHVCDPFKIPSHWRISRSMDWGFKSWGVILWWAMDPDGTLYCIREFSFRLMDAAKVAARVKEIEKELGLWHGGRSRITGPADTQLWEERGDTGISKAQEFARAGVMWKPANKRSRARNSQLLIKRLKAHSGGMTIPGIVFFRSCIDCIRTIPGIQTDANDPEAPLEGGDDHWHDAVVYECAEIEKPGVGTSKDRARESYEREDEEDDGPQDRGRYGYGSKIL